jgi:hypothetical protein
MVAVVAVETADVEMANVALVAPAAIVTLAGTFADVLLLDRATTAPPAGAALVSVTVPTDPLPPIKENGASVKLETGTCAAGVTVSTAETVFPPPETEIVTGVVVATTAVEILNPLLVEPAGKNMLVGTMVATAGLLTVTGNVWSAGSGAASRTVAKEVPVPPAVVDGLSVMEAGGCGASTNTWP